MLLVPKDTDLIARKRKKPSGRSCALLRCSQSECLLAQFIYVPRASSRSKALSTSSPRSSNESWAARDSNATTRLLSPSCAKRISLHTTSSSPSLGACSSVCACMACMYINASNEGHALLALMCSPNESHAASDSNATPRLSHLNSSNASLSIPQLHRARCRELVVRCTHAWHACTSMLAMHAMHCVFHALI